MKSIARACRRRRSGRSDTSAREEALEALDPQLQLGAAEDVAVAA